MADDFAILKACSEPPGGSVTPPKPAPIKLRLVKTHDREIICDQDGRPLGGVQSFRYTFADIDAAPILSVELVMTDPCKWDESLGVVAAGEEPGMSPKPL